MGWRKTGAPGLLAHRFTRLPAPLALVPMGVGGLRHLSGIAIFAMPDFVIVLVQIFIGINVGSRFAGTTPAALAQALGWLLPLLQFRSPSRVVSPCWS